MCCRTGNLAEWLECRLPGTYRALASNPAERKAVESIFNVTGSPKRTEKERLNVTRLGFLGEGGIQGSAADGWQEVKAPDGGYEFYFNSTLLCSFSVMITRYFYEEKNFKC